MRIPKEKMGIEMLPVPVDTYWNTDGYFEPKRIYYPLFDPKDPEQIAKYQEYEVQRVVAVRNAADADLGVAGMQYTIDIKASETQTVRTVIWFDDTKWLVEDKGKSRQKRNG